MEADRCVLYFFSCPVFVFHPPFACNIPCCWLSSHCPFQTLISRAGTSHVNPPTTTTTTTNHFWFVRLLVVKIPPSHPTPPLSFCASLVCIKRAPNIADTMQHVNPLQRPLVSRPALWPPDAKTPGHVDWLLLAMHLPLLLSTHRRRQSGVLSTQTPRCPQPPDPVLSWSPLFPRGDARVFVRRCCADFATSGHSSRA